ncbi:c-type cytochrome [Desulfosporosinus fructosivorans]
MSFSQGHRPMKIKSTRKTSTLFVLSIVLSLALFGCGKTQPKENDQPSTSVSDPATNPQLPEDPSVSLGVDPGVDPAIDPAIDPAVARGLSIYNTQCKVCHGVNGSGSGNGPRLIGKTPSASYIQSNMPRNKPGSLSSEQVSDLVTYITSLK